jgi:hypothetical protein
VNPEVLDFGFLGAGFHCAILYPALMPTGISIASTLTRCKGRSRKS